MRKHPDLVVVSDEVYEHMVFPGQGGGRHHHFASVEGMFDSIGVQVTSSIWPRATVSFIWVVRDSVGMFEQTLSIYSVGKTFSCTGWRVGYAIGPEHLITPLKCIQVCTLLPRLFARMRSLAFCFEHVRDHSPCHGVGCNKFRDVNSLAEVGCRCLLYCCTSTYVLFRLGNAVG